MLVSAQSLISYKPCTYLPGHHLLPLLFLLLHPYIRISGRVTWRLDCGHLWGCLTRHQTFSPWLRPWRSRSICDKRLIGDGPELFRYLLRSVGWVFPGRVPEHLAYQESEPAGDSFCQHCRVVLLAHDVAHLGRETRGGGRRGGDVSAQLCSSVYKSRHHACMPHLHKNAP